MNESLAGEITIERYSYNSIPGCYALIDTDAINEAGISAVQNYPTLMLQGDGIMIGFVDTGIDYRNPVFRDSEGHHDGPALPESGTRPYRPEIFRKALLMEANIRGI